jgi:hypothetical protein
MMISSRFLRYGLQKARLPERSTRKCEKCLNLKCTGILTVFGLQILDLEKYMLEPTEEMDSIIMILSASVQIRKHLFNYLLINT